MRALLRLLPIAWLLALAPAGAQQERGGMQPDAAVSARPRGELPAARIAEATRIVARMKADPEVNEILRRATGLFIVPKLGPRAMEAGQPADGVLVIRRGDRWSDPVFYHIGPVLLGGHAGAGLEALAAILLSDQAVVRFGSGETFSLSLDDGFNMANHAEQGGPFPSAGDDVVMWSDAAGLFPGAAVRLDRIRPAESANAAFHGRGTTPEDILEVEGRNPKARKLRAALAR